MRTFIISALLGCIFAFGTGCSKPKLVKPRVEDVKTIKARLFGPDEPIDLFVAKKQDHESLLAILNDPSPVLDSTQASWVVLGLLVIELKSGKVIEIHLFAPADGAGAYSYSSTYYRGSSEDEMIGAITRAYANVQKEQTQH